MHPITGYVDPGSGATLMQLALAGTIGIGALVRFKWNSIRSRFGRSSEPSEEAQDSEPNVSVGEE